MAWKILMSLWLVFVVTFVVFPGVFLFSHFKFMQDNDKTQSWYSLIVILIFNVLDTTGRKLGGIVTIPSYLVYILSFARIVFIWTSISIVTGQKADEGIMQTDTFKIINLVLFSFTNGFVSTLCSIQAPMQVKEN